MTNKKRPLSPHLSIYKLPLTAKLSILHRMTGFALFMGALIICWLAIFMINARFELTLPIESVLLDNILKFCLFGWSFSLFYHSLNGIRHLIWDMGYGFDLKMVAVTNYLVVILSLLLTILSWLIVYKIF